MGTMSDMRVEPMKHKYDSYGLFFSRISEGGKSDGLALIIFNLEFDLIFDGKNMVALWIMTLLCFLLCFFHYLLPLLIG
jgi:hypothetical protein